MPLETSTLKPTIAVLGAGAWGTALSMHLARQGKIVNLWGRDAQYMHQVAKTRCNARYLPNLQLHPSIHLHSDISVALTEVQAVLMSVPSHAFESVLVKIKPYLKKEMPLLWVTKGFHQVPAGNNLNSPHQAGCYPDCSNVQDYPNLQGQLLHELVRQVLGEGRPCAVLSGPSFALEVAKALPTAVVVASDDIATAKYWSTIFQAPTFRVSQSHDMVGVQLGGILKNIVAIAVGAASGLGFGHNAVSALITLSLPEIRRFGDSFGAKWDTLMGLSGLGDLILTCTSHQSRNYRLGFALGQGLSINQAKQSMKQVIEGLDNVSMVYALAKQKEITMPITEQVMQVIYGGLDVRSALGHIFF